MTDVDRTYADHLGDLMQRGAETDPAHDANWFHARRLRQAERREEKRRRALDDPKRRRAAYLDTVLPLVPGDLFVVLYAIAMRGDPDLGNSWPSRRWLARRLAITPNALKIRIDRLRSAEYMRTVTFRRERDGARTSSGFVLGLPPGVVGPEAWWGPARFHRDDAVRVREGSRKETTRAGRHG